jgi:glycosyltransferase involved in cell wall biosynthesis
MQDNSSSACKPTLLYVVAEDWYFLLHRLPMARAAADAGYHVHLATHVNRDRSTIEALGFEVHPLNWRRGSLNPLDIISIVRDIRRLYSRLRPDIIHHIALQPVVIGSIAAMGLPVVTLNSLVGLGFAFTSSQPKARMVRTVFKVLLPRLMNRPNRAVTVENKDDKALLAAFGLRSAPVFVLPGSGVDIARLTPLAEPTGTMTVAFVGRLLGNKGVRTLVAAHELLKRRGIQVRLLIAGEPDPANPTSVPMTEIESWKSRPGITVLGYVSDIVAVWRSAHIAVLPSRGGEGLPVSLLEAAACGRPLIATDVPGCREIARPGVNGLLVAPDDASALAEAISQLAQDAELRRRFGEASRRIVETEYSSDIVGREVVALYDRLSGCRRDQSAQEKPQDRMPRDG